MAGREGLIDTACKTARSGYLQRCIIKLLEGLVVGYDMTVRESDGSVIQFKYGEDSLDVCKLQYLKPGKLQYLADNMDTAYDKDAVVKAKAVTDAKKLKKLRKNVKKWKKEHENDKGRRGPFLEFCKMYGGSLPAAAMEGTVKTRIGKGDSDIEVSRTKASMSLLEVYRQIQSDEEAMAPILASSAPCPTPVADSLNPSRNFGSLTEKVDKMIEDYVSAASSKLDTDKFRDMMYMKAQLSVVDPGEPVGIIAAQSVGEPSTQMTLNTFHFAGRGEMNVTLGIPRLREILMVGSPNIKTPSMDIPFREGVSEKEMDKMRLKLNRVIFADLLENVVVTEKVQLKPNRARVIELKFQFLPHKNYKHNFGLKPEQVLEYFENKFIIKVLMPVLAGVTKEKKVIVETGVDTDMKVKRSGGGGGGEDGEGGETDKGEENAADKGMGGHESSDEEEVGDDDGTDVTRKRERGGGGDIEYDEMEDEEIDLKNAIDKDMGEYIEEDDEDSKLNVVNSTELDEGLGEDMEDEDERGQLPEAAQDAAMSSGQAAKRRAAVLRLLEGRGGVASIVDYSFDTEKESWAR